MRSWARGGEGGWSTQTSNEAPSGGITSRVVYLGSGLGGLSAWRSGYSNLADENTPHPTRQSPVAPSRIVAQVSQMIEVQRAAAEQTA